MQYDVVLTALALFVPAPILVAWLAVLIFRGRTTLAYAAAYAHATAAFRVPVSLVTAVVLGGAWSVFVTTVLVLATVVPKHERLLALIAAVVGAAMPNMFLHPLHVHPIHLGVRAIVTALLPDEYTWLLLTPDWAVLIVVWRTLKQAYPPRRTIDVV